MSSPTTSRRTVPALLAIVMAYALTLGALPAAAQTDTTTTQAPTETTPTETTPTETTPTETTPTETTPEPAPEPEQTAAPNEYSESVPTGSGTAPTSPQGPTHTGTGQPSTIVSTEDLSADDGAATGAGKDKKKHAAKNADKKKPHERVTSETPAPAGLSVPATPASSDVGDSARLLWLGLALLMITGGIVSTALARRRRANL
jgi:hypothetical protein